MTAPKVLISDSMSSKAADIFRERGIDVTVSPKMSVEELTAAIPEYHGLAIRSSTKATAELLDAATNLKVIGRAGIGVDNVDVPHATKRGVIVMNTPFGNAITTAEHALAMMFAVARQIPAASASTHAGKWEKSKFMGAEITGKTLGLIGAGNIGTIVAARAHGLRMRVISYDPYLSEDRAKRLGMEKVELNELLTRADFITMHVPKTKDTANMLDEAAIARMKKGAYLINCARGGLVDEAALRVALDEGRVAGAAFDVFAEEPAKENPLFGHPNVVVTPHLGAATTEAQEKVALQVAEQMSDYLLDGAVTNAINAPSLTAEEAKTLDPYLTLVKQLSSFAGQVTDEEIKSIQLTFEGDAKTLPHAPLLQTAVQAVLAPRMSSINMVNALEVAKERGIDVSYTKSEAESDYQTRVSIAIQTPTLTRDVKGTLIAGKLPRVIEIKGIAVESDLEGDMLYVTNQDKPGLIGSVGTIFAKQGINIATFHLGRTAPGQDAIALVKVDAPVPESVVAELRTLEYLDRVIPLSIER
ncbi:UNVERIFIED_CONTAM: hypothetical protein GTU68_064390 [Idotea baltica]|nr:hypothetical protein [Idotea baltica]